MAHSRLALTTMYDWIERCLDAGQPVPGDTAICERYGFDSSESARTLLAELADAGRITIRGYGEDRTITLGRQRGALTPAARPVPSVLKRDEQVERTAARLVEIAQRGRPTAAKVAASNASALLKTVTLKPADKTPAPTVQERNVMPAKTVQIPASADDVIAAIEDHAKKNDVSLGLAAASLIKRGLDVGAYEVAMTPVPADAAAPSLDKLLDMIRQRFAEQPDRSAEVADAVARAEAAEGKLAQMKALFA